MALDFKFPLPVEFKEPSSLFGWRWIKVGNMTLPARQFHRGQDQPTPVGVPGSSMYEGYVSAIWESIRAGNCLEMTHPSCSLPEAEVRTYYFHLNRIFVPKGRWVGPQQIIFETGNSGTMTTGPHCHLGVRVGKVWIDPRRAIDIYKEDENGRINTAGNN